ncbi:MAG: glycosyltransferase family 4 protein [Endomicrobium sp.]|jgi:glycosyltransferase involved in cell wall biosynthesis|nr:glycosyltransferase family 4 protein [Endomicrobium sp.]
MKILYDASILAANYKKDGSRSGIFWTAYNILKEMSKVEAFDILLYISAENKQMISVIKNDIFLKEFVSFVDHSSLANSCRNKIARNIQKLRQNLNFLKTILYLLRIVKNYLSLFKYTLYDKRLGIFYKNADVFFSPMYAIPDKINKYKSIRKYLILYDVIQIKFPQYFPVLHEWFANVIKTLSKDIYYFCISESTKHDFLELFPDKLDSEKMFVMPLSISQDFVPEYGKGILAVVKNKYSMSMVKKYIFSFCTLMPHKNLIFTIGCFIKFIEKHDIHDLNFYLGGGGQMNLVLLENKIVNFKDYRSKIMQLGYIDDEDVNILYSNALFFTYISQYEGFGIPPLEAMQAGVPVITSNNSSLPEVVGDAAITIDCNSEEQCIKAFEDFYFSEDLRRMYIQRGFDRVKLFSWKKTSSIIENVITQEGKDEEAPVAL